MHAIVSAHPDLNAERAGQYTAQWLRRELMRLRAKDAVRDASIDARIDAIRERFPRMEFWHERLLARDRTDELDLEALARGDRVAADVLVELCRGNRAYVLEPDVFAALRVLSKTRSLARLGKPCWLN